MAGVAEGFPIKALLEKVLSGVDLSPQEASGAMAAIMEGRMSPVGLAAFLTALRAKGEREGELAAFAEVLRAHAIRIEAPPQALDICGTGGDLSGTFNISTATALVSAALGVPVAKHGNRSVSSSSGSADVLAALGVRIELRPDQVERCIREAGIGFLFAPALHPGVKHAMPVRRELGVRTVFNLLGPLINPARTRYQLLGVSQPIWVEPFARVLRSLGSERALVVCGAGPGGAGWLDEVSSWGPTSVARLEAGQIRLETFLPETILKGPPDRGALAAAGPQESAQIIRSILRGEPGPAREIVLLNTSAAAQAAGLADSWPRGYALAAQALDDGRAAAVLGRLTTASHADG